jgi:TM2 domain-containing membrane protein YozV
VVRASLSPRRRAGTVGGVSAPEPRSIRVGNTEREQAVQALGDHFAQGRLEPDEFEERTTAAYAARTAADLDVLFHDLPRAVGHPAAARDSAAPLAHPAAWPFGPATHFGATPPAGAMYPVHPPVGHDPQAPYGREPVTGLPYSDRSKVVAGLLQVFLPFGVGRLYSGQIAIGVAQLLLSVFFIGVVWAFIDGILILVGRPTDQYGRPLHP